MDYNSNTGELRWKFRDDATTSWNRRNAGKLAGGINNEGYLMVSINGEKFCASRLIWKIVTGKDPVLLVDHQDLNRSNNKWDNLREATRPENSVNTNQRKFRDLPIGIYKQRGKFASRVAHKHIGVFNTVELAVAAREDEARKIYGEFVRAS